MHDRPTIHRSETRRRIAQTNLKRCPLCNALNALANGECFVCDWHGAFDHDPFRIEESLVRMIYQCPDLHLIERKPVRKPSGWRTRLGLWRKKLDLEV